MKTKIRAIKVSGFPFCYIFKCCLQPVGVYVHWGTFFENLQLCFHVVYPYGFFCDDLSAPIFCSKILPLSHLVVDMASSILPLIVGRIFFVVLERPVLSKLFGFVSVSFSSSFFRQYMLVGLLKFYFSF